MFKNKKSFVLYSDLVHTVKKMPNDKAGKLFLTILKFVNDEETDTDDLVVSLVFEPIKQQLNRDWAKYEKKIIQCSKAGKRSADSKKGNERQRPSTSVESVERTSTSVESVERTSTVNVNVSDNILIESVTSPPEGVDALHFYLAKGFHSLFLLKGNSRTLTQAKLTKWVDDVRKIIEIDQVTVEQLVAIKYYFEQAQKGIRGFDDFWYNTINSMAAFRKKNSDNEYHYDKITANIKIWLKSNPDATAEVLNRTKRLKEGILKDAE